ncbi:MAG: RloB family protein [Bacteroidales bacterium]|nr:RloB family protein [Bacteroidales bacterium]
MGGRKSKFKALQPGIYIIGEGLTERYYFAHMKRLLDFHFTIRPRFFCNSCIDDFEKTIKGLLRGDIIVICVFDADVSKRNDEENKKYNRLKKKYNKNRNVILCDSYPSIEYWFLIHYKDTSPNFTSSRSAEIALRKFISRYQKTDEFLRNEKWVKEMSFESGSLDAAKSRAIKYSTGNTSYSNIYKAFDILD